MEDDATHTASIPSLSGVSSSTVSFSSTAIIKGCTGMTWLFLIFYSKHAALPMNSFECMEWCFHGNLENYPTAYVIEE